MSTITQREYAPEPLNPQDIDDLALRQLWAAVIMRAFSDAVGIGQLLGVKPGARSIDDAKIAAREWFTEDSETFIVACEAAGCHPDHVRALAIKMFDMPRPVNARYTKTFGAYARQQIDLAHELA